MKIRRFIAAVLAVLALSAFVGCKKHDKDQTDTTGKNDETVSEDSSESTASVADVNANIKNSRYFLGIDLDGWYHWNKVGDGFQDRLVARVAVSVCAAYDHSASRAAPPLEYRVVYLYLP